MITFNDGQTYRMAEKFLHEIHEWDVLPGLRIFDGYKYVVAIDEDLDVHTVVMNEINDQYIGTHKKFKKKEARRIMECVAPGIILSFEEDEKPNCSFSLDVLDAQILTDDQVFVRFEIGAHK